MKTINIILMCILLGGWTVRSTKDPMTDRPVTWASTTSGDATLLVGCMNGQVLPRLTWDRRKGWGSSVAVTWRVDDGPVHGHVAGMFSQDGATLYPWVSQAPRLDKATRLRVSLSGAAYDFDLAAGGQALPTRWGC